MSNNTGLFGDRIKDTASAVSGSVVTLSNSAPSGFQTFGNFYSNADVCPAYLISDTSGNWEVSYGAYTSSGTTLARASTPLSSSNGNAQVSSFSGTITVACVDPAAFSNAQAIGLGSGNLYTNYNSGTTTTTSAPTVQNVNFVPVQINQWFSSVNLHFSVSATYAGTATISIGLYSNLNGQPRARLGQATGINVGTGGSTGDNASGSITLSSPQPPGLYWVAVLALTHAATLVVNSPAAGAGTVTAKNVIGIGTSTAGFNTQELGYYEATQSSLPATAATLVPLSSAAPVVGVAASL